MAKRTGEDSPSQRLKDGERQVDDADMTGTLEDEMGEFEDAWGDDLASDEEIVVAGDDDEDDELLEQGLFLPLELNPSNVYLPSRPLGENEVLEADQSAYELLHSVNVTWPSLSFDIIRDNLGEERQTFPQTVYFVAGSQADTMKNNQLTILKLSQLYKTHIDDDASDVSDDSNVDEESLLESRTIPVNGGTNRVRVSPHYHHGTLVSTWNETGKVYIYDIATHVSSFDVPGTVIRPENNKPIHVISNHKTEGYAMDWSGLVPGKLATGDNDSKIYITTREEARWTTEKAFVGHASSVEDLQWSPSEKSVFASAGSDSTIKVWDVRNKKRSFALSVTAHPGTDVNVLSWNKKVSYLLASGADDGVWSVWDLRNFKGENPTPIASFKWHTAPITSIEWHPTEDSAIAVSGADDQVTLWDLSVELDEEEEASRKEMARNGAEIPSQLMFIHQGQESIKEVHWHPQIPGTVISTALSGFNVFKTISV